MAGAELEIVDGAAAGAWIGPELAGGFGAVSLQVPRRYEAYARILHPVSVYREDAEVAVSWAQVGAATGRRVHPEVQWHALVGSADIDNFGGALWDEGEPDRGNLDAVHLDALLAVLVGFTEDREQCFFAIWNGWNRTRVGFEIHEEDGRHWTERIPGPHRSTSDLSWRFPSEQVRLPRLKLPYRDYVVLAGTLKAAARIGGSGIAAGAEAEEPISPSSPQLIWPADRSWFVASEIDFDSTLVGGSEELIAAILAAPGLEAWPVAPDSSLAADADHVNPVPEN